VRSAQQNASATRSDSSCILIRVFSRGPGGAKGRYSAPSGAVRRLKAQLHVPVQGAASALLRHMSVTFPQQLHELQVAKGVQTSALWLPM
jgi:hypothetical protein